MNFFAVCLVISVLASGSVRLKDWGQVVWMGEDMELDANQAWPDSDSDVYAAQLARANAAQSYNFNSPHETLADSQRRFSDITSMMAENRREFHEMEAHLSGMCQNAVDAARAANTSAPKWVNQVQGQLAKAKSIDPGYQCTCGDLVDQETLVQTLIANGAMMNIHATTHDGNQVSLWRTAHTGVDMIENPELSGMQQTVPPWMKRMHNAEMAKDVKEAEWSDYCKSKKGFLWSFNAEERNAANALAIGAMSSAAASVDNRANNLGNDEIVGLPAFKGTPGYWEGENIWAKRRAALLEKIAKQICRHNSMPYLMSSREEQIADEQRLLAEHKADIERANAEIPRFVLESRIPIMTPGQREQWAALRAQREAEALREVKYARVDAVRNYKQAFRETSAAYEFQIAQQLNQAKFRQWWAMAERQGRDDRIMALLTVIQDRFGYAWFGDDFIQDMLQTYDSGLYQQIAQHQKELMDLLWARAAALTDTKTCSGLHSYTQMVLIPSFEVGYPQAVHAWATGNAEVWYRWFDEAWFDKDEIFGIKLHALRQLLLYPGSTYWFEPSYKAFLQDAVFTFSLDPQHRVQPWNLLLNE